MAGLWSDVMHCNLYDDSNTDDGIFLANGILVLNNQL